jgi:uncharacterized Tic20 family protein
VSEYDTITPPPPVNGAPSAEEKQWAMFAHLSLLLGGMLTSAFGGWGFFIGPLVIWLLKKDTLPFAADQAKEALNFAILISGIFVILWILTVVTLGIGALLTIPLMLIIGIAALVFCIIGAVKANNGETYRYPVNLRLVK